MNFATETNNIITLVWNEAFMKFPTTDLQNRIKCPILYCLLDLDSQFLLLITTFRNLLLYMNNMLLCGAEKTGALFARTMWAEFVATENLICYLLLLM